MSLDIFSSFQIAQFEKKKYHGTCSSEKFKY